MIKEFSSSNSPIFVLNTEQLISQEFSKNKAMSGEYSLKKLAEISGGKYFPNVNDSKTIAEKIQKLTGFYYVLGYYIDEKGDGKYHTIKVEVSRPGCKVYAQKGYFNPKPYKEYTDLEKMLPLVDLALSESPHFQRPLRFSLKAFPYLSKGKKNLVLWAKVEKEKIQELAGKKAEAVMLLFGEEENIVKMERKDGLPSSATSFTLSKKRIEYPPKEEGDEAQRDYLSRFSRDFFFGLFSGKKGTGAPNSSSPGNTQSYPSGGFGGCGPAK